MRSWNLTGRNGKSHYRAADASPEHDRLPNDYCQDMSKIEGKDVGRPS
jgi:hypothetical protein